MNYTAPILGFSNRLHVIERDLLWKGSASAYYQPLRSRSLSSRAVLSICSGGDFAPTRDMEQVYDLYQTRDRGAIRALMVAQRPRLERVKPAPTTPHKRTRRLFVRAMLRYCGGMNLFSVVEKP